VPENVKRVLRRLALWHQAEVLGIRRRARGKTVGYVTVNPDGEIGTGDAIKRRWAGRVARDINAPSFRVARVVLVPKRRPR